MIDQKWTTGSSSVDRYHYGYDEGGNRLYKENKVDDDFSELYTYDDLSRLTSMKRGELNSGKDGITGTAKYSQTWDLSALGNWDSLATKPSVSASVVTTPGTFNTQNQNTASAYTYDANGNLTDDGTLETVFDAWNRTVEVTGGSSAVSYTYDALGRRQTAGTETFYSLAWQVLEEGAVDGSTGVVTPTVSFVWSPVYVDALIARDRDTDTNGSLDERLYVLQDANFNVTALVADTDVDSGYQAQVVTRFVYSAYGVATGLEGDWTDDSVNDRDFEYRFQGGRYDGETGTYHFRNRNLNPTTGVWTTVDPLGYPNGMNRVLFVASNPGRFVDPSGLIIKVIDPRDRRRFLDLMNGLSGGNNFTLSGPYIVPNPGVPGFCDGGCLSSPGRKSSGRPLINECICKLMNDKDRIVTLYSSTDPPGRPLTPGERPGGMWVGRAPIAGSKLIYDDVYVGPGRPEGYPGTYLPGVTPLPGTLPHTVPASPDIILAHEMCAHAMPRNPHPPLGDPTRYTFLDPVIVEENKYRAELGPGYGIRA